MATVEYEVKLYIAENRTYYVQTDENASRDDLIDIALGMQDYHVSNDDFEIIHIKVNNKEEQNENQNQSSS